jgi:hypothetical protein
MINILKWSEVWATLIPLYIYLFARVEEKSLKIIAFYLLTALCLNTIADVSWIFKSCMPQRLQNNNYLYNISSIIRFFTFILFFKLATNIVLKKYFIFFLVFYSLFFLCYFILNKNFDTLNSLLHTTEAFTLLACSIVYLIELIKSDEVLFKYDPVLLIISGLAIYESVNFFVFLFYQYIIKSTNKFWDYIWYIHDIIFIVFCILIAKAFYGESKKTYAN